LRSSAAMKREPYLYYLRAKLVDFITKAHKGERSLRGAREALVELASQKREMAKLYSDVLFSRPAVHRLTMDEIRSPEDYVQTISSMADSFLAHEPTFVEIYEDQQAGTPALAYLVQQREWSIDSPRSYIVTIFPNDFPKTVAQLLIAPSDCGAPLRCESVDGSIPIALDTIRHHDAVDLVLGSLCAVVRPELTSVLPESVLLAPDCDSPIDDQALHELLMQLHAGTAKCQEADVPLDLIRPHDPYFCLEFPRHEILVMKRVIQSGRIMRLLVYWREDAFIMSDDYGAYLAYRLLQVDPAPCTVIGAHGAQLPKGGRTGGWELLPPAGRDDFLRHPLVRPSTKVRWIIILSRDFGKSITSIDGSASFLASRRPPSALPS
jgi:hypothetical protein